MSQGSTGVHYTRVITTPSDSTPSLQPALDNQRLLEEFITSNNQQAFSELVKNYVDFVYGVASRSLGTDRELAEDVTQVVFIIFSKKAHKIRSASAIGSWLHQTTLYACSNARKLKARRTHHEQQAASIKSEAAMPDDNLEALTPYLDQAIASLNSADRTAVIGRYFQGTSTEQLARDLNSNPQAIQKRLERAIIKLRGCFAQNKLYASAAGITSLLAASASHAAPDSLTSTIVSTNSTTAATGTSVTAITKGTLFMMNVIQLKFAAIFAILIIAVGTIGITAAQQSTTLGATTQPDVSIAGEWEIVDSVSRGQFVEQTNGKLQLVHINPDRIQVGKGTQDYAQYTLNSSVSPNQIDLSDNEGKKILGIYDLQADTLRICFNKSGESRPTTFEQQIGNPNFSYLELKRYTPSTVDEIKAIQGEWNVALAYKNGKQAPADQLSQTQFKFTDNLMQAIVSGAVRESSLIELNPETSPRQINIRDKDNPDRLIPGIYEINNNTLKLYFDDRKKLRPPAMPVDLKTPPTNGSLIVLVRLEDTKQNNSPGNQEKRTQSMRSLRQISVAVIMYANDNRGRLPESIDSLMKDTKNPYLKPEALPDGKEMYVYLGDTHVSTGRLDKNMATTIIAYDKSFLTDGGVTGAFMDGHVEWITTEHFQTILQTSIENIERARIKP